MAVNIVEKIDRFIGVRHVLASVSDKSGLDTFIPELVRASPDVKIYSTGGTYSAIRKILGADAARRLVQVSDYTGQPEMQGGLVKTLDFKIYLGILGETYNVAHQGDLRRMKAVAFDLVAVNLYPFAQTVETPGATPEQARANIDIGGPCMAGGGEEFSGWRLPIRPTIPWSWTRCGRTTAGCPWKCVSSFRERHLRTRPSMTPP